MIEQHEKVVDNHAKVLEEKTAMLEKFCDLLRAVEEYEEPVEQTTRVAKVITDLLKRHGDDPMTRGAMGEVVKVIAVVFPIVPPPFDAVGPVVR